MKNLAVTKEVLRRLDPALLDPLPEVLASLEAYQAANYRWRNWRELYQHALRVPADRLDEAGALWGPCQLADRTLPPRVGGRLEVLPRLAALAPMGICSQNDRENILSALSAHGAADCFSAVVGHADVDFARQKPDPAAFLACLDRLGLREGRFAYIGDHAGDIAFGRNAQAALRAMGPGGGGGLRGRRLGRRPVRGFGGGGRRGRPPRGPAGSAGRPVTQQRPRRELPGGAAVCLPEVSACALFSGVL